MDRMSSADANRGFLKFCSEKCWQKIYFSVKFAKNNFRQIFTNSCFIHDGVVIWRVCRAKFFPDSPIFAAAWTGSVSMKSLSPKGKKKSEFVWQWKLNRQCIRKARFGENSKLNRTCIRVPRSDLVTKWQIRRPCWVRNNSYFDSPGT